MSEQKSAPPADPTAQPRPPTGTDLGRVADATPMAAPFGDPLPAPMNAAEFPPIPGEEMVLIRVPREIRLTLDDHEIGVQKHMGGNRVDIPVGQYELPARLADHWYVQKNAVHLRRRKTAGGDSPLETGAKPADPDVPPITARQAVPLQKTDMRVGPPAKKAG